MMTTDNFSSI